MLFLQLNGKIDMPLLTEPQERQLLQSVINAALSDASVKSQVVDATIIETAQGLTGLLSNDAEGRKKLVWSRPKLPWCSGGPRRPLNNVRAIYRWRASMNRSMFRS